MVKVTKFSIIYPMGCSHLKYSSNDIQMNDLQLTFQLVWWHINSDVQNAEKKEKENISKDIWLVRNRNIQHKINATAFDVIFVIFFNMGNCSSWFSMGINIKIDCLITHFIEQTIRFICFYAHSYCYCLNCFTLFPRHTHFNANWILVFSIRVFRLE